MQAIATRIFIASSLAFGVLGILMVFLTHDNEDGPAWLMKSFFTCVFIILPSFALSVAGKYLNGKK